MTSSRWTAIQTGALALILVCGAALAGCGADGSAGDAQKTDEPRTETSSSGQTQADSTQSDANPADGETRAIQGEFGEVTIPAHPKRPAGIYLEDYMVALGVTPVVQWYHPSWGIQDYLDLDAPKFDISGSPEALLAEQPDLIMLDGGMDKAAYETYEKIAPTYRLPEDVLQDSKKVLLAVADALGIPDKGQEVLDQYEQTVADDKAKLQETVGGETVAVLRLNGGDKTMALFGVKNRYTGSIYSELGLTPHPLAGEMTEYQEIISEEGLADLDADHIFIFPANGDWDSEENKEAEKLLERPVWQSLKAVKNDHVYVVERSYWQSGGIRANLMKFEDVMKHLAP
ncbi:ABC transporter substrate-binding protein [Saccharibacillus sp. CPCC 101409]|uniref:ABC transporter substrate-binding protein n=1 Tax=Saccharibacillus sp. CPCC 101409 TaxID=3058041 RepID=UPI0026741B59|nr:ABC transporter substrate-binding protein [Saccharibacillus sp. CPCC 101409]MDO3411150.1 ABC transporter substrate-binding protein [Saccharibacillus sp. CPCC 101409]